MKTVKSAKGTSERKFVTKSVDERLAGGFGMRGAKQDAEALLRRAVMTCLLWENLAYESGANNADNIARLIPQVDPKTVATIAIEASEVQKLRHVPLYIASVMAGLESHKGYVQYVLSRIIKRPDQMAEFLAIYWKNGRSPISAQIKKGLASAFGKFNEYQFGKYRGSRNDIKLRDVLRLVHPAPADRAQNVLFGKIKNDKLATPDTWEVALSSGADARETWTRLISGGKLGALAYLRNLRNMKEAGVEIGRIKRGFAKLNPKWLLPLHFLASAKHAPDFEQEIEALMLRMFDGAQKLPGYTVFVVDLSGSMSEEISDNSKFSRMDVAMAMAMIAGHMSEYFSLYATAGSDLSRVHKTVKVKPRRGFATIDALNAEERGLGGGGIFTRQCLEYIKKEEGDVIPDRIIIFSDSQDCDLKNKVPAPFGKRNYIVDVSAHEHGVNYDGVWDAEISGWSEGFINFIMAMEGVNVSPDEEESNN